MARKGVKPSSGARMRHREIHHGTRPTTTPGASKRKTALPKMAHTRPFRSSPFLFMFCLLLNFPPSLLHSSNNGHPVAAELSASTGIDLSTPLKFTVDGTQIGTRKLEVPTEGFFHQEVTRSAALKHGQNVSFWATH